MEFFIEFPGDVFRYFRSAGEEEEEESFNDEDRESHAEEIEPAWRTFRGGGDRLGCRSFSPNGEAKHEDEDRETDP